MRSEPVVDEAIMRKQNKRVKPTTAHISADVSLVENVRHGTM
jgi:hypothetical protein